ncbi:MAG: DUF305 domain-containing protein [Nanoarchaeota archaeon]
MGKNNYKKFLLILTLSFFIMYIVMFLNVYNLNHVYLSLTRLYMALLMVSAMSPLMLVFMKNMYKNKKLNKIIILISIFVFLLSLILLRIQVPIGDEQYIKAMIPHHSSAILTSQEANIKDPEVKILAEQIIEAQEKEIEQMKNILERLE